MLEPSGKWQSDEADGETFLVERGKPLERATQTLVGALFPRK